MRTIGKLRVKYSKGEPLRFISHLEVVSAIRQSVRRADLPVCFSEGFSPQPKISFGPPLAVGYTSNCEIFDMEVESRIDVEIAKKRLKESTPKYLDVISVLAVPIDVKAMELFINVSKYSILMPFIDIDKEVITSKIKNLFDSKEFFIERLTDKSKKQIDVRPLVINMILVEGKIEMLLRFGPGRTAKPDVIIQKIFDLSNEEKLSLRINRDEIFHENEIGEMVKQ
ncbi:MAG: hypothetical protein A2474_01480 [Elusimicrobia bacterium RIFOXYC2_FULL_34_12]|nr:MAG: hypothetical protein A2474_01480 [Elusimicrobia bacterium RIFOXYC2_FULL_34_12]OGS38916.1 MAG: hypothetical protein A2551_03595 [Elusimicrobia bacterium RIFOXYD2_FULL_34_30]